MPKTKQGEVKQMIDEAINMGDAHSAKLQSSMPVAVFNYLLAQRYDREPSEVAGLVVVSTLMSFMLTPLLLANLL